MPCTLENRLAYQHYRGTFISIFMVEEYTYIYTSCTRPRVAIYNIYIYKSYLQTRTHSPATLCPNCNAIGALLSELYDFGPDKDKLAVTFLYIYISDCSESCAEFLLPLHMKLSEIFRVLGRCIYIPRA
jgi:hypothetical protein